MDTGLSVIDADTHLTEPHDLGVWAQIVYPNAAGFGGQRFSEPPGPARSRTSAPRSTTTRWPSSRSRAAAACSRWRCCRGGTSTRPSPRPQRAAAMGLRGVNMTQRPAAGRGARPEQPRVGSAVGGLRRPRPAGELPHRRERVDACRGSARRRGRRTASDQKLAIGSTMMYLTNARVLANLIISGLLERHPTLKFVSVESGVGWIPFVLEAIEHQLGEVSPGALDHLSLSPLEYFQRQMYACFWFETPRHRPQRRDARADNILFETDFPHPTCLYPDSMVAAAPLRSHSLRPEDPPQGAAGQRRRPVPHRDPDRSGRHEELKPSPLDDLADYGYVCSHVQYGRSLPRRHAHPQAHGSPGDAQRAPRHRGGGLVVRGVRTSLDPRRQSARPVTRCRPG